MQHLAQEFFPVPLQVYNDAQISVHSDFASVCEFMNLVMRSYARALQAERDGQMPEGGQSLEHTRLVFKHHPMDRGHRHYNRC